MRSILEAFHEYRVSDLGIRIVDRDEELLEMLKLLRFGEDVDPRNSLIYVVSGPWGCGKTEFARALTRALSTAKEVIATYINVPQSFALEEFYGTTPSEIVGIVENFVENFLGDRGKLLFNLYKLVKHLVNALKVRNRRLVLIFDEVTSTLDRYRVSIRDLVAGLSKEIYDAAWSFGCEVYVVMLTSECTALYDFKREEGKNMVVYQMWHLDKKHLARILEELGSPHDVEAVWKLCGGCPRAVYELWRREWMLERWVSPYIDKVRISLQSYARSHRVAEKELLREISRLVEDLDALELHPLWNEFLKNNVVTPIFSEWLGGKAPPNEAWIGNSIAFQMPIYRTVLETMAEEGRLGVEPSKVLRRALS